MGGLDTAPVALPFLDGADDRLAAIRRAPGGAQSPAARETAARAVEVMFLTQLVKAMRDTVPESDFLPRSPARSVYEGVFDRTLAESIAERDPLGFVRSIAGPPALKSAGDPADTAMEHQVERKGEPEP